MSKIVFTDVDGVLLPGRAYALQSNAAGYSKVVEPKFCPIAVELLNRLVRTASAYLVISSSWGTLPKKDCVNHFWRNGVTIDRLHEDWTANSRSTRNRRDDIDKWLAKHPEVESYVIIDDGDIAPPNAVRTHFDEGLLLDHYRRAAELIGAAEFDHRAP